MAKIQFSRGTDETVIPDIRLTRSKDGSQGTAQFSFEQPDALAEDFGEEITGMYLIDEEGELSTFDVKAKFINGKPEVIEAQYLMRSLEDWERFMRFMNRYAEKNGLGFNKSE
ncbi:MAG: photosystem II reaction center protein Psb28 [Oscillatoriales cyanobacterium RM2_1_1]|nr:photosystem II reaction center protein Psb28 [Oscillatoriales cyanobacterium SM2_3_0]NJO45287.1 photosystem II reaction center protein Psb28 [Oscillatoriales cyanobacterium RM2_1_1]